MNSPILDLACIIDDDKIYINLIKKIIDIKKLAKNLLIFENGKIALDHFKAVFSQEEANIPDIILLDLNMPEMDGWEFLENLKTIKSPHKEKITLYIVSSSINPADKERAKNLSMVTDYLIKPVRIDELERVFIERASA